MSDLTAKEQRRIYDAEYYRKNREKKLLQVAEYSRKNPEKRRALRNSEKAMASKVAYVARYPEKIRAKNAVSHEVRCGRMKRLPCRVCGATKIEGHHPDYTNELEVIWLCQSHHKRLHSKRKNLEATFQGDLDITRFHLN